MRQQKSNTHQFHVFKNVFNLLHNCYLKQSNKSNIVKCSSYEIVKDRNIVCK